MFIISQLVLSMSALRYHALRDFLRYYLLVWIQRILPTSPFGNFILLSLCIS
jgi:hypothetical protein